MSRKQPQPLPKGMKSPAPSPAPPMSRTVASVMSLEPITFTAVAIMCCDCGVGLISTECTKPKELAKSSGWKHAGTGKWQCVDCAKEGGMNTPGMEMRY
jgi:hypothetical protein